MRVASTFLLLLLGACASKPRPAVRTEAQAPLVGKPVAGPRTRIAFGSCARQDEPQPVWRAIAASRPDLFLFIGDNVYADRPERPTTEDDLRTAYAALNSQPEFRAFRAAYPIEAVWDDHDYGVNDGGADNPLRAVAEEVFLEFWEVDADDPRRARPGLYHARTIGEPGRRVQVIFLDTRSFRSSLTPRPGGEHGWFGRWAPSEDPEQTMLGEAQWAWLEEQLSQPAELRLLVSSIQVVSDRHGWEKWATLPRERERLFALLRETEAEGLVILSGDRHKGELSMVDAGLGYPLYDFTSSGLNTGHDRWFHQEPNPHRVATMRWGDNFGLVEVDWSKDDPLIELTLAYADGQPAFSYRLRASTLKKGAMPPYPTED